jgi:hypothetical protein
MQRRPPRRLGCPAKCRGRSGCLQRRGCLSSAGPRRSRQIRQGRCAVDPAGPLRGRSVNLPDGQMGVLPHGTRFGAMDSPTAVGGTAEVSPSLTATLRTSVNLFNVRIRSFPGLAVTKSLMTMSTSPSLMGLRAQAVHLVLFASRASWVAPGALVSVTPTSTTSTDTVCRGLLDDDALQPVSETTTTAATSRQHIRADPTLRGSKGNLSRATVSRSVARHRHHPLVCRRSGRAAARQIRQGRCAA